MVHKNVGIRASWKSVATEGKKYELGFRAGGIMDEGWIRMLRGLGPGK